MQPLAVRKALLLAKGCRLWLSPMRHDMCACWGVSLSDPAMGGKAWVWLCFWISWKAALLPLSSLFFKVALHCIASQSAKLSYNCPFWRKASQEVEKSDSKSELLMEERVLHEILTFHIVLRTFFLGAMGGLEMTDWDVKSGLILRSTRLRCTLP